VVHTTLWRDDALFGVHRGRRSVTILCKVELWEVTTIKLVGRIERGTLDGYHPGDIFGYVWEFSTLADRYLNACVEINYTLTFITTVTPGSF
jgi:hypothetical protein